MVRNVNNAGIVVDWEGINGFIPSSQVGKNAKDKDDLTGKSITVKITEIDKSRKKIAFSEKTIFLRLLSISVILTVMLLPVKSSLSLAFFPTCEEGINPLIPSQSTTIPALFTFLTITLIGVLSFLNLSAFSHK